MKLHDLNTVGADDLYRVVSVSEAARMFHRSPRTIRHHITAGNVAARRIGRDYIISVLSLRHYYRETSACSLKSPS